jgi:hypothetical protein
MNYIVFPFIDDISIESSNLPVADLGLHVFWIISLVALFTIDFAQFSDRFLLSMIARWQLSHPNGTLRGNSFH